MDVTRLSRGEYHLDRHRVDLAEVVRAAVEDHRLVLSGRQIAVDLRTPFDPVVVHADAARLTQVVGNLLMNAGKFTTTMARTRGGLGLGLAVVKKLVELHGGTVHGASAGPGKGAAFVVTMPLALPDCAS